ncbi:pumilio homolog 3-like [Ruditapes philippinarum]|uniref:pumilio homolog 3-like n=1 Tax=Ruditapes philippinarum TaxID=129788 RepID=UPI00295BCAD1|nr:pumilio homolog 3-like [Ruditapes philippinarum]XP_060575250.1 pumilio homolog 3-like [Ruditapes philippinarum]XP_060575251.1 pumilio homolog 3-like [Ruditapes philippinarum]
MEVSRRQQRRSNFSHQAARGNPEGDSIIKKQRYKVGGPQADYDTTADYGMSPVKRRKQHGYENYHSTNKKGHYGQSYLESEVSTLDITDTPDSLSQISAIAPVSDISNIQPSFARSRHSKMAADTTWENAVSHARGEPDGAEKSFHKKKSKVSIKEQLETVPEEDSVHSKGSSGGGSMRQVEGSPGIQKPPPTAVERKKSVKGQLRKAASVLKKARSKSKLPENKVGVKRKLDATLADETMTTKPDTKELSKKERKHVRKALKTNFEQIQRSKKIWEELRRFNVKKDRKLELCNELYDMVKDKMKEFCFAHDTARVIQCLIQYGTPEHRERVFEELKEEIPTMSKSKYAKFLVKKMLMYGTKHHRSAVYKSFHGHVRQLIRHKVAADVVEYAYNEYANAHQRLSMLEDFYGPSFCLFKTPDIKCLGQIMLSQPDKRDMILRNMREALLPLIDKNILVHSMVHKVFMEYFTYADGKMKAEMIEALRESVIHMLHTRDGARVAMQCIWHGTAKDRKTIIKSFKGNVVKICQEEYGHLVMLSIFDCVDDTKIVKAALLEEMMKSLNDIAQNQYGRKVLLYLLSPRDSHHFCPDIVRVLQEGDASLTSKKEKSVRYQELLGAVSDQLLQYIVDNVATLVVNNNMLVLIVAIITHAQGDPTAAMEAVASIAAEPFVVGNTEGGLHIVENPAGHMTLKWLIQNDKQRIKTGQKVLFSEVLLKKLPEGALKSWAACNRGCFILVCLLDLEHSEITKLVVGQLMKGVRHSLKKMTFKGAQILAQKLDEAKTAV